jgi:hypothetical protein
VECIIIQNALVRKVIIKILRNIIVKVTGWWIVLDDEERPALP